VKRLLALDLALKTWALVRRYRPKIVAVTGSVGKTATKDAIALALASHMRMRATKGNYNNEIGVPLTLIGRESAGRSFFGWIATLLYSDWLILKRRADYPKVMVLEYGADKPGDIEKLCRLAPPAVSVVTAASMAHTEGFGSVQAVAEEKGQLVAHLPANGTAVLNADEPNVLSMRAKTAARVVTYGFSSAADVRILSTTFTSPLTDKPVGLRMTVSHAGEEVTQEFPGVVADYQLGGVAAAIAVTSSFGISLTDAIRSLASYRPPRGRMNLLRGMKDSWLLDDSYNSSPLAAQRALQTLKLIPGPTRRIAVLGYMAELGELSAEAHQELGARAADTADMLVVVGEQARGILTAAREAGMTESMASFFQTAEEAAGFLQGQLHSGDIVLVKGSQVARTENVVKMLMAEPQRAAELLVRQGDNWRRKAI
jgi:UDP-N-acetylmuramyl pentapeptide synthase